MTDSNTEQPSTCGWEKALWRITPRDPLVIGDGRGPVPFVTRTTDPLPLPSTVAGLVRALCLQELTASERHGQVSSEDARAALENISIRGPFLERTVDNHSTLLVFPPLDAVQTVDDRGHPTGLRRGKLVGLNDGEGVLWDDEQSPGLPSLVQLPALDEQGRKTRPLDGTFWSLEQAVRWALGERGATDPEKKLDSGIRPESRVHDSIDPTTGTADDGQLFGSSGLRFDAHSALIVEVARKHESVFQLPTLPRIVTLGGEGRPASCERVPEYKPDDVWGFESFRARYDDAIQSLQQDGERGNLSPTDFGIRLQLLTHGCFEGGWRPGWLKQEEAGLIGLPPALEKVASGWRLKLEALCLPRQSVPISGWNLQGAEGRGAPRRVRRLVPAGAVYYFSLVPENIGGWKDQTKEVLDRLQELCATLWFQPMAKDPGKRDQFEANPHRDGFGMVLPGIWRMNPHPE